MPPGRQPQPRSSTRRATPSMADVAALAGVSSQTVSRVANGAAGVRESTRAAVLHAMAELGYLPNAAARALKYGAFRTIGVITHQLARAGESHTVEGIVEAAREVGYGVSLIDVLAPASADLDAAVRHLSQQSVDGLIIIRAEPVTMTALTAPVTLPVVVSDSAIDNTLPTVVSDQRAGTQAAVEHLLALGHRTVHHVAGPQGSLPSAHREQAWRDSLRAAGAVVPEPIHTGWTARDGYAAGQQLAGDPDVTAVFCANDQLAIGVIRAMFEAGRAVPHQVSVIGFDDLPESEFAWPPLTTVRQDFREIGRLLCAALMDLLADPGTTRSGLTVVPTALMVRASTAAPPTAR